MNKKIDTLDLLAAIGARYPRQDGWIVINEVEISRGRRIDSLALHVFPSRGFLRYGFEVKVNRADWLRELREPEKSQPARRQCHDFYLVVPPGIVQIEEVPADWGLLEGRWRGGLLVLHQVRKAMRIQPTEPSLDFLCRALRRVIDPIRKLDQDLARKALDREHQEQLERQRKWHAEELEAARKKGFEEGIRRMGGRMWEDDDPPFVLSRRYPYYG